MATFPIPALGDILFRNLPTDKGQGIEIFTDESLKRFPGRVEQSANNVSIIRLKIAPQDIQFSQRSRISEQVIKDGRAFFFWRKDRFSSHLDLLELRLNGITRSLAPEKNVPQNAGQQLGHVVATVDELFTPSTQTSPGGEDVITAKQRDWLFFWRLTREPFVTENGINNHHIRLHTPAIPMSVDFVGHFAGPLDWRHSARNPFLVEWSLTLIVHSTSPDLEVLFNKAENVELVGPP